MFGPVPVGLSSQRLLPEAIPLRFFGTAVTAHLLVWIGVVWTADGFANFVLGPGPPLAVIHTLTAGVLLPTAMAATLQMLPVVLARPAPSARSCNLLFVVMVLGGTGLVAGMASVEPLLILAGAGAIALGITVYTMILVRLLRGAAEPRGTVMHTRTALISLIGAVAIAVTVAINYRLPILADPWPWAIAHATLAGFGFMGFLALGFGTFLMPMFAMADPPDPRKIEIAFWCLLVALAAGIAGVLVGSRWAILSALALALMGCGLHLRSMTLALASRMRKRLGPEFLLIRAAWVLLPAALIVGLVNTAGVAPDRGPAMFVFVALFGWLLTLLMGVLQRILPFLASMHTGRVGGTMAAPTRLTDARALAIHRWCHAGALLGVGIGIGLDAPALVRAGGLAGVAGAGAFGWFALAVLVRTRAYLRADLGINRGRPA